MEVENTKKMIVVGGPSHLHGTMKLLSLAMASNESYMPFIVHNENSVEDTIKKLIEESQSLFSVYDPDTEDIQGFVAINPRECGSYFKKIGRKYRRILRRASKRLKTEIVMADYQYGKGCCTVDFIDKDGIVVHSDKFYMKRGRYR